MRSLPYIVPVLLFVFSPATVLADPQLLGTYQAWNAYSDKDNGQTICYVSAKPAKSEGDYKKRSSVFAEVTHRPAEHHNGIFNLLGGYIFKTGSTAILQIGTQSFTLFTHGDAAFAHDADDAKIVAAMRGADSMVFTGASSKGTQTKDTFSLKGLEQAYREIGKACDVETPALGKSGHKKS